MKRLKKSCWGCKALRLNCHYSCALNFLISNDKPGEVCPKPRTYKKLVELLLSKDNQPHRQKQ